MKKLLVFTFALGLMLSCTPETDLENEQQQTDIGYEYACPAPDTNCNGIPDHEE